MNQAGNGEGPYDPEWYRDDQQLPPSLGVWPLGRTYVHSSDGALNTGPTSAPGANGHGGPARPEGAARRGSASNAGNVHGGPGAGGRGGRPPLYQVGGRYRGDDWPTDPGFRRGDLGLDESGEGGAGPMTGAATDPGAYPAPGGGPAERVAPIRPGAGGQAFGRQGRETWERNVTPAARVAAVEDAKLLAFLHELVQRLKTVPSLYPRLVFLVVGYAAITSLAAAYAEKVPLPITASLIVIPAAGIIFNLGMRYPDWGRRALTGWIAGIIATIVYDMLRLALVKVGIWGDPIPGIGRLVLADPHANFAWGYFWRFTGNGGGMGIAYAMLPWRGVRTGIAYGTLICTGLVALLFFFPVAQVHFFPLTPVTTVGAYAGHWVYGAVLGKITAWWLPPVELGRIHGRLTARLIHPGHRPRPSHVRGAAEHDGDARRATDRRSA